MIGKQSKGIYQAIFFQIKFEFFQKQVIIIFDEKQILMVIALVVNMIIGIIALITGKTGEIITIACFGALSLYIISMVALIKHRKTEPELERPFRVPLYPLFPLIALVIASIALLAITIYNLKIAAVYFGIILFAYIWFYLSQKD